jgi:hypothetical protein
MIEDASCDVPSSSTPVINTARAVSKGNTSGTIVVLAACGRESRATGQNGKKRSPFTQSIIEHLNKNASLPHRLSVAQIQYVLALDKGLDSQSPVYIPVTGFDEPLILTPLHSLSVLGDTEGQDLSLVKDITKVSLAVTVQDDAQLVVEECVRWMTNLSPTAVKGVEVEDIVKAEVEVVYKSWSTLLDFTCIISTDFRTPRAWNGLWGSGQVHTP